MFQLKKQLEKTVKKIKKIYSKTKHVHCPAIGKIVYFNVEGFHHLRYRETGKVRNIKEQIFKLSLFPLAVSVVKYCEKVEEYRKVRAPIGRKRDKNG